MADVTTPSTCELPLARTPRGQSKKHSIQAPRTAGTWLAWEAEGRRARQSFSWTPSLQTLVGRTGLSNYVRDLSAAPNDTREVSNPLQSMLLRGAARIRGR